MAELTENVHCGVYTWKLLNDKNLAEFILNRVKQEGSVFEFDRMGHHEPFKTKFDPDLALELWCSSSSTHKDLTSNMLFFEKREYPHTLMSVSWQTQPKGLWLNTLAFTLDLSFFNSGENVSSFVGLVSDFFTLIVGGYGKILSMSEAQNKDFHRQRLPSGSTIESTIPIRPQEGLIDVYWANLLGPPYVHMFSHERIESCPAHRIQQIGKDSYLLLMSKSPGEWSRSEVLELSQNAKMHLNSGAFFDRNHPENQPVPPQWPHNG